MNPTRMKNIIRTELATLRREQIIDSETYASLLSLYPGGRWDYSSLSRWFLIFGSIAFAAGLFILGAADSSPSSVSPPLKSEWGNSYRTSTFPTQRRSL